MSRRWNAVKVSLSDDELAALRALPGDSDPARIRAAIARASKENRVIVAVAEELLRRVDSKLAQSRAAMIEQMAPEIERAVGAQMQQQIGELGTALRTALRAPLAEILARLPARAAGGQR